MTRDEAMIHTLVKENDELKTEIGRLRQALEQDSVLDKIRAEICDLRYGDEEKSMTDEDMVDAYNNAIEQVIEIIDKYKTESEE